MPPPTKLRTPPSATTWTPPRVGRRTNNRLTCHNKRIHASSEVQPPQALVSSESFQLQSPYAQVRTDFETSEREFLSEIRNRNSEKLKKKKTRFLKRSDNGVNLDAGDSDQSLQVGSTRATATSSREPVTELHTPVDLWASESSDNVQLWRDTTHEWQVTKRYLLNFPFRQRTDQGEILLGLRGVGAHSFTQ